jgi:hypothetical protein
MTAFRRELACVRPRPLDVLELAASAKQGELALRNGLEVSPILRCGFDNAFPANMINIPVLEMISYVAPFRTIAPDGVLLCDGAGPCFAKSWIWAYRLPYQGNLLEGVTRLVWNGRTCLRKRLELLVDPSNLLGGPYWKRYL